MWISRTYDKFHPGFPVKTSLFGLDFPVNLPKYSGDFQYHSLRAIFFKSHPTCDSRVFRISSYFNQLKIKVIPEYGGNFSFIRHFVEFLGGRETTAVFQKMQSVSTSYILKPPSASENCFSKLKLPLHETC